MNDVFALDYASVERRILAAGGRGMGFFDFDPYKHYLSRADKLAQLALAYSGVPRRETVVIEPRGEPPFRIRLRATTWMTPWLSQWDLWRPGDHAENG
jgi:hypothetical protein